MTLIPWIPNATALPRLAAWTHGALLLAILACLWFPATPLPLGGPNVVASSVLVFLAGLHVLVSAGAGKGFVLSRTVWGLLAVVSAMLIWACGVTIVTDTFSVPLVGQIAMGGSVLAATWVAVDTARRARMVATMIVGATAISVLFGLAVIYIGDPLWRVWVVFANPEPRFANDVLLGRIAGISPRVVNLAFQLVVATPLAVGLLLYNPWRASARRRAYDTVHYMIALILSTGIYFNTSRSAALAGLCGVLLVLASAAFAPRRERPAVLRRTAVVVFALAAGCSAVVATHQAFAPEIVRPAEREVLPGCETPIGAIAGEREITGTWDSRCTSLVISTRIAHLYTFSVDSPRFVAIELASDVHPYLYLLRGTGGDRELGNQNNENHDGGVGTNARLVDGLMPPGDYTLEVTTKYPGQTGDYTLTISTTCGEESLGLVDDWPEGEGRMSGWSDACPPAEGDPERPARYFTFEMAKSWPIAVYVQAEGLLPTLRLRSIDDDQEWQPVTTRRETTGDRSKVLRAGFLDLPAGGYRMEIKPQLTNVVGNFGIFVRVPEAFDEGDVADEQPDLVETSPPKTQAQAPRVPAEQKGEPRDAPGSPRDAPGSPRDAPGSPRATSNKDTSLFDVAPPAPLPLFKPDTLEGAPTTDRVRLVSLDAQAYDRVQLAITALRYAKEFPLGTGGNYKPQARHVDREWGSRKVQAALAFSPHNQFLLCLVQYGVPGLVLLLLLYGGSAGALLLAWRRAWSARRSASWFLSAAIAGALAGYVVNSFFHDHGPFTKDWFNCVLIGLALAVGLRVAGETGEEGEPSSDIDPRH